MSVWGAMAPADQLTLYLAWADFKIKVKQIVHSTLCFDQWNPLISKMWSLKIFPQLFLYSDQHAFWNSIENKKKYVFEILASKSAQSIFLELHFWNQWLPMIQMSYRLSYLENFHFSNLIAALEAVCWKFSGSHWWKDHLAVFLPWKLPSI